MFVLSVGTTTINPIYCNRICLNGGVCNLVNNQEFCVCPIGFSGLNCEVQGSLLSIIACSKNFILHKIRSSSSLCCWFMSSWNLLWANSWSKYTCLLSMYGWLYRSYMQPTYIFIDDYSFHFISFSIGYFTCPSAGVFPDTPQCRNGRFFYCQQALAS